jgi:hypothetical protein
MTEGTDLAPAGVAARSDGGTDRWPVTEADAAESDAPFARHVLQRTVVLPELRVLYLPMPKAACTSILWLLSEIGGMSPETFARSDAVEASAALTIHDMTLWEEQYRLASYEGEERDRILSEDGWLRFSTVRHPAPRLWSAWHSKLLLREPRFVATFGDAPWFPRLPERADELVEDFRRFVRALPGGAAEDVHWSVQHDLIRQLPLTHVGRVERLADTLARLRAHVSEDAWPPERRRDNRTFLPMPAFAYDEATAAIVHERYRADFEHYGYDPIDVADGPDTAEWEARVEVLLPALHDTVDKHTRIGQLHRLAAQRARRVQALEEKVETTSSRQAGRSKAPILTNLEGRTEYNVRWGWADGDLEPGFTAVVRVKNEARSLPWVLPPLLRAVSRVVVVDNGSTDGTAGVARAVAGEEGALDRLDVVAYPFSIARCGQEHLETPATSVHSLAYFYNWSFSHVRTRYAVKWDGDMVLSDPAADVFRALAWQLEAAEVVVKVPRYPLYVADDRRAFLDMGLRNCEPWAWPNRPGYSFVKAMEWELPLWAGDITMMELPDWSCVELKYLDEDEFAHWSPTDFDASVRTQRKRREWDVFHALVDAAEPPRDVVVVEAPPGQHVIDYVRATWLVEKAEEPARIGERLLQQFVDATG